MLQLEDSPRLGTTHEVPQRTIHGGGVGLFAAQTPGLVKKITIKHKICTFHVYRVTDTNIKNNLQPCWTTPAWRCIADIIPV